MMTYLHDPPYSKTNDASDGKDPITQNLVTDAFQKNSITKTTQPLNLETNYKSIPNLNVIPLVGAIVPNVLQIQVPKFHDNDDPISHLHQFTKVCVTNGENIEAHKLQYFPNTLKSRRTINWFAHYEITNPTLT